MRRDSRDLLLDLADEGRSVRRQATLDAAGKVLRRRRVRRIALRGVGVMMGMVAGGIGLSLVLPVHTRHSAPIVVTVVSTPSAPNEPKALSDAELLGLFPNTPVALAQIEPGKKRLIFPRPGDEARFVKKL